MTPLTGKNAERLMEEAKKAIKEIMEKANTTPITQEALRERGFVEDGRDRLSIVIKYNSSNGKGKLSFDKGYGFSYCGEEDYAYFPGCKTMQDIDDLIRLLGGDEG